MRVSEDNVWTLVARTVALRSKCVRSQVGCVLVDKAGRVISTGYNGPPSGHTPSERFESCASFCSRHDIPTRAPDFSDCPSVHAELNALLYAEPDRCIGATAYLTRDPCWACAKALAAARVSEVVVLKPERSERWDLVRAYFVACGMGTREFS